MPEQAFEGTVLEGKERRYTIINEGDYQKYVSREDQYDFEEELDHIQRVIQASREREGKKPYNSYIVINTDEPYIQEIIAVMRRHGHFDWGGESLEFKLQASLDDNSVRLFKLTNGTVFTVKDDLTLLYEEKLFYEVEFEGYEGKMYVNPSWKKTGTVYTAEALNKLVNEN